MTALLALLKRSTKTEADTQQILDRRTLDRRNVVGPVQMGNNHCTQLLHFMPSSTCTKQQGSAADLCLSFELMHDHIGVHAHALLNPLSDSPSWLVSFHTTSQHKQTNYG